MSENNKEQYAEFIFNQKIENSNVFQGKNDVVINDNQTYTKNIIYYQQQLEKLAQDIKESNIEIKDHLEKEVLMAREELNKPNPNRNVFVKLNERLEPYKNNLSLAQVITGIIDLLSNQNFM